MPNPGGIEFLAEQPGVLSPRHGSATALKVGENARTTLSNTIDLQSCSWNIRLRELMADVAAAEYEDAAGAPARKLSKNEVKRRARELLRVEQRGAESERQERGDKRELFYDRQATGNGNGDGKISSSPSANSAASASSSCTEKLSPRKNITNVCDEALKKAGHPYAELLDVHAPLRGKEKFLGGSLGADNCIYGIPGHAKQVLKIDPDTGETSLLGGPFDGEFKWLRGVLASDGCVYGIPSHGESVLRIFTSKTNQHRERYNEVEQLYPDSGPMKGIWKWHGGILGQDGNIYGVPCNADQVLKIDIQKNGEITMFGDKDLLTQDAAKWYGGQMALDGSMYAIPQNSSRVLRICPKTESVSLIGPDLGKSGWKWHGGNFSSADGCIYGIPNNNDTVLRIDPQTLSVCEIGANIPGGRHRDDGKYKFLGGVTDGAGNVYCIAGDADRVLKIEISQRKGASSSSQAPAVADQAHTSPTENKGNVDQPWVTILSQHEFAENNTIVTLKLVGESLHEKCGKKVQNKWQNGFFSKKDGCIYGIPLKAETMLRICTVTDQTSVVQIPDPCPGASFVREGNNKWEGGVFGADGSVYCMPLLCKYVLRLVPGKQPAE
ncbi:unnamed protein product [Amoebophrya sp. A120]|nr:unnamed protein product [Amoebophrya sp. A120]|eukprot:GSA120T00018443001.1